SKPLLIREFGLIIGSIFIWSNELNMMSSDQNVGGSAADHPMKKLLDEGASGMNMLSRGEVRDGIIARITPSEILVDVGAKSEGIISGKELEAIDQPTRKSFAVGQVIPVYVLDPEDRNGNPVLSYVRAREEKDWQTAERLLQTQEVYSSTIAGYNKGGIIVKIGNVRGFIPASQVSAQRRRRTEGIEAPEQKWGKMIGEPVQVKVIEVDRNRNRLILSERAASKEAREMQKEKLLAEIKPGDIRTGHVISLADFGAFVDIGGADGLVHLSEISWKRINHPKEVLQVGQEVEVEVLSVDPVKKRIGLSIKRRETDPWTLLQRKYQPGNLLQATITKLTKFGAFARIEGEDDVEGLIHVSELAEGHVEHPKHVVSEGQQVTLRVLKIDPEKRRIGLSLKRAASPEYADTDWASIAATVPDLDEVVMGSDEGEL
ncbi:MAG: S1 RNA-binding domain-containing protein, partial [Anaerolineales bacterium]|nr:S1 RNA-binding domain-containing protein [Anaerolineales bacterium]